MAYQCPHCGGAVRRSTGAIARALGGLVAVLFAMAFGSFECPKCGKIKRSEFPDEVRRKMTMGSVGLVAGGFVIAVVALVLIVVLQGL